MARESKRPAESASSIAPAAASPLPAHGRSSWRQHLATALTLAACFLIALALGMGIRGWPGERAHGPDSTVTTVRDEFPLPAAAQPQQSSKAVAHAVDNWELVSLSTSDSPDSRAETFRVPAVHAVPSIRVSWIKRSMPSRSMCGGNWSMRAIRSSSSVRLCPYR